MNSSFIRVIFCCWQTISRESQTQHDDDRPHRNSILLESLNRQRFFWVYGNLDDDDDQIDLNKSDEK